MPPILTADRFTLLLDSLESHEEFRSERYEELRERVTRVLRWKGCPESEADALADVVLDRTAFKLAQGESIGNVFSYASGVARFVWLEHCRAHREHAVGDDLPEIAVQPAEMFVDDPDERVLCLRKCLNEVARKDEDRRTILSYYDSESGASKIINRRRLAESLGVSINTLQVRACRLRARLEACINECVARVSEPGFLATARQEEP